MTGLTPIYRITGNEILPGAGQSRDYLSKINCRTSNQLIHNTSKIIDRLNSLNPNTVKLGLENISRLLNSLGNPHLKLNTVHIAGTNGKGSTAIFLYSIFKSAGYKTGLYLSPHLIDVRERITVGSAWISEKRFSELIEYIFHVMEKKQLSVTFFEFITALAFLYFFQEKIDIGIIEVGLGGRLDATNVLKPLISVITEIDLEHTNYLGSSIREIATEKGGIIKPDSAVFLSAENNDAIAVLKNISKKKRAICFEYRKDFLAIKNPSPPNSQKGDLIGQTFSLKFEEKILNNLDINTLGTFQIKNSSIAVAVALYLSEKYHAINENSIREGLKNSKIPCRMELVWKSPRIVLDAAHNYQAIQTLIESILHFFTYKHLIVVLGILKEKNYKEMIKVLSPEIDTFIMTEPKTERALSARLLEKESQAYHNKSFIVNGISGALNKAKEIADPHQDLILVTGSFFTVGEALSEIKDMKDYKLH